MATLPANVRTRLDQFADKLKSRLGDNLHACVLYGSAVRGDFVLDVSDVNLLIVLDESTPAAHTAIIDSIDGKLRIDPMIIGRPGMERSFEAFALKFRSIARDYEVLHGADPFEGFVVRPELERFPCEQALRNVRLRLVRGFVVFGTDRRRYTEFLIHWIPTIFIDLSAALRLGGTDIPHDFDDRLEVLESGFGTDISVLRELLALKENPPRPGFDLRLAWGRRLSSAEIERYHDRIFRMLSHAIDWMANRWPSHADGDPAIAGKAGP